MRSLVWNLLQWYVFRLKKFEIYWICRNSKQVAIEYENNKRKRKILNYLSLLLPFPIAQPPTWDGNLQHWTFINLTEMMAILWGYFEFFSVPFAFDVMKNFLLFISVWIVLVQFCRCRPEDSAAEQCYGGAGRLLTKIKELRW